MINFLRRCLGMDLIITAKQLHIVELTAQICSLQASNDVKSQEIKRLTDLILTEHGVIKPEGIPQERKTFTPLNRRPNFRSVQRQLEEADRGMASKQVDAIKEYWEKKQADGAAIQQEVKAN